MMTLLLPLGAAWCARIYRRCACGQVIVLVATATGDLDYCRRSMVRLSRGPAPRRVECCGVVDTERRVYFPPRCNTFTREKPSTRDV